MLIFPVSEKIVFHCLLSCVKYVRNGLSCFGVSMKGNDFGRGPSK